MAIQSVDLKVPNGDTPRSAFTKINANFSDPTNAASRLVGTKAGNVMRVGAFGLGGEGSGYGITSGEELVSTLSEIGSCFFRSDVPNPITQIYGSSLFIRALSSFACISISRSTSQVMVTAGYNGAPNVSSTLLSTRSTTTDGNGFIKAASPIVKVFANKVELNDDATLQDVTFTKNGVGDYTITTVSGLSTDGWYIELPKDLNGNPKVAVTLTETDGVISLKCYKHIFSMETFTFAPDLDEPLDVPDGRWIDLRLNEIPVEHTDLGEESL